MLSARNRMRESHDFVDTTRRGVRGASSTVVVHLNVNLIEGPPLVGFVVSKAVGNSVVRHRVQRKLRHICRERVNELAAGTRMVVRALPGAASASFGTLESDLDAALAHARRRLAR